MLYSERKRIEVLARRKANGEDIWTRVAPSEARNKLLWAIGSFGYIANSYRPEEGAESIKSTALKLTVRATGRESYSTYDSALSNATDDEFMDIVEATARSLKYYATQKDVDESVVVKDFNNRVNDIFESYYLSFSLEGLEIVEFQDRELHEEVVSPTLSLLANSEWATAESAYKDALRALGAGRVSDSITDVTTALQEGLRIAGCKGDNFADLIKSAKSTIFVGFDAKYLDGLVKLIDWSSAVRAKRGDGHVVANPSKEDAWLAIHLVGALLLYLSKNTAKRK